jgi:N-acetylated-alpha-linked acidic dipeptidase
MSVATRAKLKKIANANADDRKELRQRPDLRLEALGSGTDFTVFLDHLGVASLNLYYEGEDDGGIYHSIYDDFYWYTHFSDYDFIYGRALAQTAGTAVLRMADAPLLPFEFTNLADTMQQYLKELQKLLKDKQDEISERNTQLDEGLFKATFDPRRPTVAPSKEMVPPFLNFAPLQNSIEALQKSADRYKDALAKAMGEDGTKIPVTVLASANQKLMQSERRLTNPEGLLRRSWYKHLIYAPGVYTGYGVKTMPGVREGIEQKRWQEAEAEVIRIAKVLQDEAELIDSATAELNAAAK